MTPLYYAARFGWRLLPVWPGTKVARMPHTCAKSEARWISAWDMAWPDANWAVVCGQVSGIVVIDVDGHLGEINLARLEQLHGPLPYGPVVISGSGRGEHRYFRWPEGRELRNGYLAPNLEFRGDKLLVTLPPSRHPSGYAYVWERGHSPDEIELPELPEWICEAMAQRQICQARHQIAPPASEDAYLRKAMADELALLSSAPKGQRNYTLNLAAFSLMRFAADGKMPAQAIEAQLLAAAFAAGLGEHEALGTIRSAARARGVGQ